MTAARRDQLKLHLVRFDDGETNLDLLVWAYSAAQATDLWRHHFEVDLTPEGVSLIPTEVPSEPQPISWELLLKPASP